ncbi:MAG: hypothetical protein ACI398_09855 [Clostridium sp.]
MTRNKKKKSKMISTEYATEDSINDYVEGFIDEEGPDIRRNDELNRHEYTLRIFPNPDW